MWSIRFCRSVTAAAILAFACVVAAQDPPREPPPPADVGDTGVTKQPGPALVVRAPKIDPALREAAATRAVLPVIIYSVFQPQRQILERLEGVSSLALQIAEGRYAEVARRSPFTNEDLERAHKPVDDIILALRKQATVEIRDATRPWLDRLEGKVRGFGASNVARFTFLTALRAEIPVDALDLLEGDEDIEEVTLVRELEGLISTSVPFIGANAFWNVGFRGSGQSVVVLDSGITKSHPAFGVGRIVDISVISGFNPSCLLNDLPSSPVDVNGHGTHVAGVIASAGTLLNPLFLGVAPQASTIVSIKVLCHTGTSPVLTNSADLLAGIDAALEVTSARVFNISIGGTTSSDDDTLTRRVDRLQDLSPAATIVVSAGNNGPGLTTLATPGIGYNVISVANANRPLFNTIAPSSSRGPTALGRKKPDIAAPGSQIYSANNNFDGFFGNSLQPWHPPFQQFVPLDGTSMAAPHIAGTALLLRQVGITGPKSIKALLLNTTDNVGWQSDRGWGYVNLVRAQNQSGPSQLFSSTVTGSFGATPYRLYKGSNASQLSATLVWNRYVAQSGVLWTLTDLDLIAYRRTDGFVLSRGNSDKDNVEQIFTSVAGDVVLKVDAFSQTLGLGLPSEPYALAVSNATFVPAVGPILGVSCSGPGSVQTGSNLTVTCTARNDGDLEALAVSGELAFAGGQPSSQGFGAIAPGATIQRSWNVTAPSPGNYTLNASISSTSFEEFFGATGNFSFISSITGTVPGPTTPGGLRFVSLPPCRIMETRPEYNFPTRTGAFGPPFMNAGETRTLTVPNSSVCSIPTTAKAYVLNVTLIPRGGVEFVTVWPGGEARPNFRTVRSPDGLIVANAALVKPGAGGTIQVYASHNTDLIIDISGYFTDYSPQVTNLVFYPMTPCRVIDTRLLYRPQPGPFGPPSMEAQVSRRFKFPDTPYCNVPAGAAAYSFTLTAVPQGILPFMTAWPSDQGRPNVSSINSPAGRILANSVILPASPDGSLDVYAYTKTDFLVDINGYFAPDDGTNGQYYYPVTQCRVSDSTSALPAPYGGPMYAARSARTIPIPTSGCAGIPANAKGFALNVTALPGGLSLPFVTAYPAGQSRPTASILNAFEGQVVTNSAIIPSGSNGAVEVYAYEKTHVVVEVSGFFGR